MNSKEFLPVLWTQRAVPPRPPTKPLVDYRDRISVITWLFVFALGISQLYTLPTTVVTLSALGSPMSIALTKTLIAAVVLAIYAAAGAESVIRVHPRYADGGHFSSVWQVWALPMAIAIIAVYVVPMAPTRPIQVLLLLASGGVMMLAMFSLYATIERGQAGFRRSRLILDMLSYSAALVLFLFVYQTRTRSLLSGTLVALTATLLAVELLRSTASRSSDVLTYGAITGMILGQVTWALNYWWSLNSLTGGLTLLLIFYVVVGIAQHGLQEHLTQRVLLEFVFFAIIALVLITVVAPRFG
ncbi:MAG: hypothetical protein R3C14_14150 [Caldilineaceae bacterium]